MVCLIFYTFYVVYDGTNYFMLLFVTEVTVTTSKHTDVEHGTYRISTTFYIYK